MSSRQSLRVGETVKVRSADQILATLDDRGELDAVPFMAEMLQYCGHRFTVHRRAMKLCDTVTWRGLHRMEDAVHLAPLGEGQRSVGLRCDGSAHGGCQAGCILYFKEAWLERVDGPGEPPSGAMPATAAADGAGATLATLVAATRADGGDAPPGEERYACQATAMPRAAPVRIPWWDARQYVRDVRAGNVGSLPMLRSLAIMLFNKFQTANRRFLPRRLRLIRGGQRYPFIAGTLERTPKGQLGLRPGELVEVKSKEEIVATLTPAGKNRGLSFDAEMLRYCGSRARVLRRVDRIIDEATGRMMRIPGDCIVLEGVVCRADYAQYCTRAIYPYWRELWLRRVEEPSPGPPAGAEVGG